MSEHIPVIKGGGEPWVWSDGTPVRISPAGYQISKPPESLGIFPRVRKGPFLRDPTNIAKFFFVWFILLGLSILVWAVIIWGLYEGISRCVR